jgi:AraC-like DNA-binding protein
VLSETVFRSEDLPVADRFDAWRACMGQTHAPMELSSEHAADYRAHLRLIGLGAVSVWPATFQQLVFQRTPKLIRRSDPEVYHLSLIVAGDATASWGEKAADYRRYDIHTNDSSRPYEIWTGRGPITSVGIELPKDLVPLSRSKVDQVIGRPMSSQAGIGALLAQFLAQLTANTAAYRPADAPRLGTIVSDLVSALFAHALDEETSLPSETASRTLILRIKDFIHRHLGDHELTPSAIAAAHHISRSYLHRLFQAEDSTVAAYIRHKRLEAARRDLADPALHTTPVSAIGATWGYPHAAAFCRAFRAAYGMPPADYRHQAHQTPV